MQKENGRGVGAKERARDRLAAVGFIASLVGHPVRNRLAGVRAVLELLDAGMEQSLSSEHRATVLREFNAFIDNFNLGIEMVRCDFGRVEEVSAREVVGEAVDLFRPAAERAGIAIELDCAAGADRVWVDRALLRQSILNLLRNAAEALGATAGRRITLKTGNEPGRRWIEVADNGPGVPARLHDRLFREAVTGWPGGTGLGLSLCRDAMTLMDGSIDYLTPKGAPGARFRLNVPAKNPGRADGAP
jgi:signal transduction histidine kinase